MRLPLGGCFPRKGSSSKEKDVVVRVEPENGVSRNYKLVTFTIDKEQAICDICCSPLPEDVSVVQIKNCKCDVCLVHKECADKTPECSVCEQAVKYKAATLSTSARPNLDGPSSKKVQHRNFELFRLKKGKIKE